MPTYTNPNNHTVVISLSEPRVSMTVYPQAWPASRLPTGARREVELDEYLAREFVKVGMLTTKPAAEKPNLTREAVVEMVKEAASQGLASVVHQEARKALPTSALPVEERPMTAPDAAPPASSAKRRQRYAV